MSFLVASFYRFAPLDDLPARREALLACCRAGDVQGTILLAEEGVNGTIAGPQAGVCAVLEALRADPALSELEHKEAWASEHPFHRLKVRLKSEIVTMGVPGTDPTALVGSYLDAEQWNAMLEDPDTLIIDTRNQYEVDIGTFPGAVSPQTAAFREFPDYVERELGEAKDRKVAMFCTGGIRCEKATSYLKAQGFDQVYHLKGGILKYLETVDPQANAWQGECYVFDNRVAVDAELKTGEHSICHACRRPVSAQGRTSEHYRPGVSCAACVDEFSEDQRAGFAERHRQVQLAAERGERHVGARPVQAAEPDER